MNYLEKRYHKLVHMATTPTGWAHVGESRNSQGPAPDVVDITALGRCGEKGTGLGVGQACGYTRKATKKAANSELLARGYDFCQMPQVKQTHITRVDGVYIVHDWTDNLFARIG